MPETEAYRSVLDCTMNDGEGQGFPDDFKEYMEAELSLCRENRWGFPNWVFFSRVAYESERPHTSPSYSTDFTTVKLTSSQKFEEMIKRALQELLFNSPLYPLLVQFWTLVTIEGRSFLTTRNQPFALSTIDKQLCQYRMKSKEYKFYVDGENDEDFGLLGRVFLRKWPESTPNVGYYSTEEYPQREHALHCRIKASLALPVFERQSCVGVFELVTTVEDSYIYTQQDHAFTGLKAVGLICPDVRKHSVMLDKHRNKHRNTKAACDEIKEVLGVVCKAHELCCVQTWVPCSFCSDVVDGHLMSIIKSLPDSEDKDGSHFTNICKSLHLREGQGVVGRALLSHNLVFCADVTQFSIADYPLVHYARKCGLSGCFAICLQSSYTENDVYVLELFLPPNNEASGNLRTSLGMILRTMKQSFQTFKLASGEDLGEELPIKVIDFCNGEGPFQKTQTTGSPPMPEALQNGRKRVQLDPSNQRSMDLTINGRNVTSAEQSNVAVTHSQKEGTLKKLERPQIKTGFQISFKDLQQHAGMKLTDAAKSLGVSRSTLKRICREYDVPRWPPLKMKKDYCSLPKSVEGVYQEQILQSSSDTSSRQASRPSTTTAYIESRDTAMQDANIVTIKAKYANDINIKFDLWLPSGLVQLQKEVAKRLKLKGGAYRIKYIDEDNDLILISCDEDLQKCILTCRSLGNTSIVVLLEPKKPITPKHLESY